MKKRKCTGRLNKVIDRIKKIETIYQTRLLTITVQCLKEKAVKKSLAATDSNNHKMKNNVF